MSGAKCACLDIEDTNLQNPINRYEYMKIKASLVPEEFKQLYNLHDKVYNGFIHMEVWQGIYGLPQADILANKLLKQRLANHGYFELPHTPGLFKHTSQPIQFTLVVDDFGIKYTEERNPQHLIDAIEEYYTVS